LVTFAAALIESEERRQLAPEYLKQRLLVSADLNPALAKDITDGRTLNIAKAISVFDDVVELSSDHKLLRGALRIRLNGGAPLSERASVLFDCQPDASPVIGGILKIWPHFRDKHGKELIKLYYVFPNDPKTLFQAECELGAPEGLEVGVDEGDGRPIAYHPLADFEDIVRQIPASERH
jgi:hypothetical protein